MRDLSAYPLPKIPPHQTHQGHYIRLEPIEISKHLDDMCALELAPEAVERYQFIPVHAPRTRKEVLAKIERYISEKRHLYVIYDQVTNKPIGYVLLHNIIQEHGVVEVGLYYSLAISKKPGGTEAMYLIMRHAFDDLGYRRFEWCTDNRNEPSKYAAERLGFTYEAILREECVVKNDLTYTAFYSVIDKDWSLVRESLERWLDPSNFDSNGVQMRKLSDIRKEIVQTRNLSLKSIVPSPPVISSMMSEARAQKFDDLKREKPSKIILDGRYVRLEPLAIVKHCDLLYEICSNHDEVEIFPYLFDNPPKDREDFKKWLEKAQASEDTLYFMILDKKTRKIAGRLALSHIRPDNGVIEIGQTFWSTLIDGRLAEIEMLYLVAKHVFDELNYHRLEWKISHRDIASQNCAKKIGFTYEGTFRQAMIKKGQSHDIMWYSMLGHEWPRIKIACKRWLATENFDEHDVE